MTDVYTHGHADADLRSHRRRTAANSAGYLLPHLTPQTTLLDVGCGPGTITADLARQVPDGAVVGLDRSAAVLAEARSAAAHLDNVSFVAGDVYGLGYADGSFDVVHAHQVLQHLSDPVAGLREMRRVCAPGGLVAARDSDYGGFLWWPAVPVLEEWLGLYHTLARGNSAEPDAGRHLPGWARAAGFAEVTVSASAWCFTTEEERLWWAGLWADRVTGSAFGRQARERGLATVDDLQRIADGWHEWADHDDASFVVPHVEILCRCGPR